MLNLFITLGKRTLSLLYFLGGLSNLVSQAFYWTFIPPLKKERILEQAKKAGLDSLPLISLVAFFIGVILYFFKK